MPSHILKLAHLNLYGIVYASGCDLNVKLRTLNGPF